MKCRKPYGEENLIQQASNVKTTLNTMSFQPIMVELMVKLILIERCFNSRFQQAREPAHTLIRLCMC